MSTNAGTLLTGRLVTPNTIVPDGALVVDSDRIVFAGKPSELPRSWADAQTPVGWTGRDTLLPGLVDIHCHGGSGGELGEHAASGRLGVDHHPRRGTASLIGSLVSNTSAALGGGVATCAALVAHGDLAGIHLEGPLLSMDRRDAQSPAALCDVDPGLIDAAVEAASGAGAPGAIAQMTFAPERPGATDLPALLGSHTILAAVGHTSCDAVTAGAALRAGLDAAPRPLANDQWRIAQCR